MPLQLGLSAELRERLKRETERRGQSVETVALHLREEHLPLRRWRWALRMS